MAMTPDPATGPGGREPDVDPADTRVLDRAASALRAHTDDGWQQASSRVLDQILRAARRSRPVRGLGDGGTFHVSDHVITSHLQDAVDRVAGGEATHVDIELDGDAITGLSLGIAVDYPLQISSVADAARAAAYIRLTAVLGDAVPFALDDVAVRITDVEPPAALG